MAGCRDCPGSPKAGVGKPGAHREDQLAGRAAKANNRPSAVVAEGRLPSELKFIAAILERPVIEKILKHLGLEPQPPPRVPGREAEPHLAG